MLGEEIRAAIRDAVLSWFTTVSSGGEPNVSPKQISASYGEDGPVIADFATPVAVRNVRAG